MWWCAEQYLASTVGELGMWFMTGLMCDVIYDASQFSYEYHVLDSDISSSLLTRFHVRLD